MAANSTAPPTPGGAMPFRLGLTGYAGHARVEPIPPIMKDTPLTSLPDLILPPAFPPETVESMVESIEQEYLIPSLDHEEDSVHRCGRYWDFDWFEEDGPPFLQQSLPRLAVVPVWVPPFRRGKGEGMHNSEVRIAGWLPEFQEVQVINHNEAAHNSSSILRRPGRPEDFVKGSRRNHPFHPGGFEISQGSKKHAPEGAVNGDWLHEVLEGGPLQTVPPGFKEGIDFGVFKPFSRSTGDDSESKVAQEPWKLLVTDKKDLCFDELFKLAWEDVQEEEGSKEEKQTSEEEMQDSDNKLQSKITDVEKQISEEKNKDIDSAVLSKINTVEKEFSVLEEVLRELKEENQLKKRDGHVDKEKENEAWAVMGGNRDVSERFSELVPDMALNFPFELDNFQKEAIYHLERSESVFVAAHTSAGKTVVAEYAFALAAKHCTRAVYTSPIKTISNQKYRDFSEKFDVGLLTGDVSLRPDASCLIMTTEILRSMLYKGADIVRDIEWVVFDEVHYVNDVERGVVWEEVIIMLPDRVNMVLLSATVPNTLEFADWIGRTKQKKIYVTGSSQRPVPLEHCLYYSGELYKICENEIFLPDGVKLAKKVFKMKNSPKVGAGRGSSACGGSAGRGRGWTIQAPKGARQLSIGVADQRGDVGRFEPSHWYSLLNNLSKKRLLPVVVFCFSKNRCDQLADNLTAANLTTRSEKSEIRVFCDKAFSMLKGSDRVLPQVVRVQNLLCRGIGVHHAGLLPIVKEVVEMLFCRGVIKILFSTETFAMGVNAPARTVAFQNLRKHDGKTFRQLLPGEYTQMAGRAGRRGLDKIGSVIIMCWDDIPEGGDLKHLLTGKPTKLESQFRLTYSMILNLLRVEDLKIEDMLKRSFAEFHAQRSLPEQQQQLLKGEGELSQMKSQINCILGEPTIEDYYELATEAEKLGDQFQEAILQLRVAQKTISPGRIVIFQIHAKLPTIGVVLRGPSSNMKTSILLALNRMEDSVCAQMGDLKRDKTLTDEGYIIVRKSSRVLEDEYSTSGKSSRKSSGIVNISLPYHGNAGGTSYVVLEVDIKHVISICKTKIQVDTVRLLEDVSSTAYSLTVQKLLQLEREYPDQDPPPLDPIKDLKINELEIVEEYHKRQDVLSRMAQNKCHRCPKLFEHYTLVKNQQTLKEKVKQLKFEMSDAALQQMPDFQQRIEVLRDVGCVDMDLVVQLKGRVACEINSGDELIATECLFDNQLVDLEPAEAVALLSALVFQQKDTSKPFLTPRLKIAKRRLMMTAIKVGKIQASYGLPINPEDYARDSLKFGLMEVVYEWAKGTPFADICALTDVPEGSIVRTIVRLDETCREFKNAARIIGDSSLYKKMDDASISIKRDIVFAASLYVTGVP